MPDEHSIHLSINAPLGFSATAGVRPAPEPSYSPFCRQVGTIGTQVSVAPAPSSQAAAHWSCARIPLRCRVCAAMHGTHPRGADAQASRNLPVAMGRPRLASAARDSATQQQRNAGRPLRSRTWASAYHGHAAVRIRVHAASQVLDLARLQPAAGQHLRVVERGSGGGHLRC